MNKRNMSTVEASLYTFGILFLILVILAALGVGDGSECAHYNCDNEVSHEGDYCYMHRPNTYKSYNNKKKYSSGSSYNGTGSNSSSGSNYNSSVSNLSSGSNNGNSGSSSNSHNTSSSTTNKKYNSNNSYDDGYDDVYMEDDYDWDRYREDDDYASGVDDALEDMEDGDW